MTTAANTTALDTRSPIRTARVAAGIALTALIVSGGAYAAADTTDAETAPSVEVAAPLLVADPVHVAPAPDSPHVGIEIIGLDDDQTASVERVADLFDAAGLDLPPLVVRGSVEESDCSDHDGVHRNHGDHSEVILCSSPIPGWERRVVGHELAHAWVAHNVTDEQRTAFQEIRGWTHWKDYEAAAWRDNGTEQAADVISWGIYDQATALQIDVQSCDELHAAYSALTGLTAPQSDTSLCDQQPVTRF